MTPDLHCAHQWKAVPARPHTHYLCSRCNSLSVMAYGRFCPFCQGDTPLFLSDLAPLPTLTFFLCLKCNYAETFSLHPKERDTP